MSSRHRCRGHRLGLTCREVEDLVDELEADLVAVRTYARPGGLPPPPGGNVVRVAVDDGATSRARALLVASAASEAAGRRVATDPEAPVEVVFSVAELADVLRSRS